MWKAPSRPLAEISQSYNDGVVTIYAETDGAEPGYQPVPTLTEKIVLRYEERRLGIQRYYQAVSYTHLGQGKVAQPRVGIFTSNGDVSDGPLDDYLARGRRILFDGEPDKGFLPFICCLESKEQVHDPTNW